MVFSGDVLKETYSKFKPEYTCWFDKSTWKYLDKYQVLCLQVQVSTKYFWISKCQVQVSTKYSRFCIKYQVSSTSTLLDPNPAFKVLEATFKNSQQRQTVMENYSGLNFTRHVPTSDILTLNLAHGILIGNGWRSLHYMETSDCWKKLS